MVDFVLQTISHYKREIVYLKVSKTKSWFFLNEELCIKIDEFCSASSGWEQLPCDITHQELPVGTNDEFCIENEEFCIKKEEVCIKTDESCRPTAHRMPSQRTQQQHS